MYSIFLFVAALSPSGCCESDVCAPRLVDDPIHRVKVIDPAIAEKTEEWLRKQPPDKIGKLLFPILFKDLSESLPVRIGMTKAEVAQAIPKRRSWPITKDKYSFAGHFAKEYPEEPFFVGMDGRIEGFAFIFFKEDRVESIWCQLGRVKLAVGPPFVLRGDPKPRKAVQLLFADPNNF